MSNNTISESTANYVATQEAYARMGARIQGEDGEGNEWTIAYTTKFEHAYLPPVMVPAGTSVVVYVVHGMAWKFEAIVNDHIYYAQVAGQYVARTI